MSRERVTISSRPSLARPITVAYRAHVRELAPGSSFEFRLVVPATREARPPHPPPPALAADVSE